MRNLLLKISYEGSRYHGWQVQSNALAVQTVFQEALYQVLAQKPDIKGCSRTDTGVHAREYAVSFKTDRDIPCQRLVFALNRFLPPDIAVLSCSEVPQDFHARYSCRGKEYSYEIWNDPVRSAFLAGRALHYRYKIDEEKLNRAAAYYQGTHDFTSFCTTDKREKNNMVRTVSRSLVERRGKLIVFTVRADGFLYNMVRIMTGTLLAVNQGRIQPEEIPSILEKRDRKAAGPTAPACGLYLNHVFY
jgi:tRNA pseudouridine38-40 synthase